MVDVILSIPQDNVAEIIETIIWLQPIPQIPDPATEGSLFLDTNAGANGTLVIYSNAAWRTVAVL